MVREKYPLVYVELNESRRVPLLFIQGADGQTRGISPSSSLFF